MLSDEGSTLMVDLGGVAIGFVTWHPVKVSRGAHALEFGVGLWPQHRGKGHGSAAQRLLATYLFDHWPVHRIQAWTETGNVGEQRALEKAGFIREGILAGYGFRGGAWRDVAIYRMLRHELPA